MISLQKHLLFENEVKLGWDEKLPLLYSYTTIWSDRLVLIQDKNNGVDEFWQFTVFDLLMNEERKIHFQKSHSSFHTLHIYPLNNTTGFIVELSHDICRINLVKFNWSSNEFQLIEAFQRECWLIWPLVDRMDTSKFVLQWWARNDRHYNYQFCKFLGEEIEPEEEIYQLNDSYNFYSSSMLIKNGNFHQSKRVTIYDLLTKQTHTLEFKSLLEHVSFTDNFCVCVNDCLYIRVEFKNEANKRLVCLDLKTKDLSLLDFEPKLNIRDLKFFNNNLMVFTQGDHTEDDIFMDTTETGNIDIGGMEDSNEENINEEIKISVDKKELEIYSIPIKHPNHLRYSAWLLVVKVMKNRGEKDHYLAAKEFLPLNSDLRAPWFKDEKNEVK